MISFKQIFCMDKNILNLGKSFRVNQRVSQNI